MVAVLLSLGTTTTTKTYMVIGYVCNWNCMQHALYIPILDEFDIWFSKWGPSLSAESQWMGGYRLKHSAAKQKRKRGNLKETKRSLKWHSGLFEAFHPRAKIDLYYIFGIVPFMTRYTVLNIHNSVLPEMF